MINACHPRFLPVADGDKIEPLSPALAPCQTQHKFRCTLPTYDDKDKSIPATARVRPRSFAHEIPVPEPMWMVDECFLRQASFAVRASTVTVLRGGQQVRSVDDLGSGSPGQWPVALEFGRWSWGEGSDAQVIAGGRPWPVGWR